MALHRHTFAEINLKALEANLKNLQKGFSPKTFLCPMVKANAYSHGDVLISLALESFGVRHLGVSLIEEGVALREAGIQCEILAFLGRDEGDVRQILKSRLTPVVSSWEEIRWLEQLSASSAPVSLHLKFDTGMNRLGFSVTEAQALFDHFKNHSHLRVSGILTHLSKGEDANDPQGDSLRQLKKFAEVQKIFLPLKPVAHALNSAGILHRLALGPLAPAELLDLGLRPGLLLYGYNPVAPNYGLSVQPVMTLRSEVEVYHHLRAGEGVSYNSTWKAQRDSVIAVVPIGYADGYHRVLSNKAQALFGGERVSVVGSVCMDYLMLDVTDVLHGRKENPREEVVLFGTAANGSFLGADELAKQAGTITWEILTSVGARVPKKLKGDSR